VEDGRRLLVRRELPTGVTLSMRVEGLRNDDSIGYVGQAGPLTLKPGERRYIPLQMYATAAATPLDVSLPPSILPTLTPLSDGRLLVAGGFQQLTATACSPERPSSDRCFALTASDRAHVFDPATGQAHLVVDPMLAPRAGHTATLLPDGRVMIAGGASRALLVVSEVDRLTQLAWQVAQDAAHAHFEWFDPERNAEMEDVDRDGDPAKGGFVGGPNAAPVPLNYARFLHGAAAVPDQPSRVVLAGGLGSPSAAGSYEVYDDLRPEALRDRVS